MEILDTAFLGNPLKSYLFFIGWVLFGFIFKKFISKTLNRIFYELIRKYSSGVGVENFYGLLNKPIGFVILISIFYIAFSYLDFPETWHLVPDSQFGLRLVIHRFYQILFLSSCTWIIIRVVDFIGLILLKNMEINGGKHDNGVIIFTIDMGKIIVGILGCFIILGSVFKLNISSLIAGLGIGGLAIALAAKESIENLLCSFTIFFDKPFGVGDLIQVGNVKGYVEKVGFRSTRIRTLDKTYLTLPNKKVIDAELDNLSMTKFRRAHFMIRLNFQTTMEQMKGIVADIQKTLMDRKDLNKESNVRFDGFGKSSLNIMVEYFVKTDDWDVFLDVKQEVNFKIMEIVEKHGSSFAVTKVVESGDKD